MALTNTGTILKPLISALANQPTALGELSSGGITVMVGTAVLCSLYGLYWDARRQMVFANYVPGEGYAWMVGYAPAPALDRIPHSASPRLRPLTPLPTYTRARARTFPPAPLPVRQTRLCRAHPHSCRRRSDAPTPWRRSAGWA